MITSSTDTDTRNDRYAETVAVAPGVSGGWSLMAGIMTVTETQANHNSIYVRLFGTHPSMNVFYDDISVKPIPKTCDELVLNSDFEAGNTAFWLPTDKDSIDVDVSSSGANGSNYSMIITKYTPNRIRQQLDARCFTEGQEYLITAKFKLVDSANPATGLSCNPNIFSENDIDACPKVIISGARCASGSSLSYDFWNQKNEPWNTNDFNDYEYVFPIDADMASCEVSVILSLFQSVSACTCNEQE